MIIQGTNITSLYELQEVNNDSLSLKGMKPILLGKIICYVEPIRCVDSIDKVRG